MYKKLLRNHKNLTYLNHCNLRFCENAIVKYNAF